MAEGGKGVRRGRGSLANIFVFRFEIRVISFMFLVGLKPRRIEEEGGEGRISPHQHDDDE